MRKNNTAKESAATRKSANWKLTVGIHLGDGVVAGVGRGDTFSPCAALTIRECFK